MTEAKALKRAFQTSDVAALVATYFPDEGLPARLGSLLEQFDRVALVDNGSSDENLATVIAQASRSGVTLHRNSANLGIATALNQGMAILADEGFSWVVTFDQDSTIRPGFVTAMLETLERSPELRTIAVIGANRIDPDNDAAHRWLRPRKSFPFFERVPCDEASRGVTTVITSGSMTSVAVFNELGGFRDELFIDMVDFDYCLRARERGYQILVSCGAELTHKVGHQSRRALAGMLVSSTHHSPLRRYYLFRNSVHLIKRHGRSQPHWLIYQLLALGEVVIGILVSETDRARKIRACALGIIDGLAGRGGQSIRDWSEQPNSRAVVAQA